MLIQIKDVISSLEAEQIVIALIVIICLWWLFSYMSYFNIFLIIKAYISQYKDDSGKYNIGLLFGAYVIPALIAVCVLMSGSEEITQDAINGITLIITVLTALFFTIIGLVADLKIKIESSKKNASEIAILNRLCNFIFEADMFEIAVCILLLIFCFFYMLDITKAVWLQFVIYYLSFLVLVNIFILLKRLYVVLKELLG